MEFPRLFSHSSPENGNWFHLPLLLLQVEYHADPCAFTGVVGLIVAGRPLTASEDRTPIGCFTKPVSRMTTFRLFVCLFFSHRVSCVPVTLYKCLERSAVCSVGPAAHHGAKGESVVSTARRRPAPLSAIYGHFPGSGSGIAAQGQWLTREGILVA